MSDQRIGIASLSQPLKTLLLFLSILALVVPCVLGFVNFDKRLDITEIVQKDHIEKDEAKWEKAGDQIDEIKGDIHGLELIDRELEIKYAEILRRLEKSEMNDARIIEKLDNLVKAE